MKQTLTKNQAADILLSDNYANWTYSGAIALIEYLEDFEQDTGEEIEFDAVALRCGFSEYESVWDCVSDLIDIPDDMETENDALEWLQDRTTVIKATDSIIVQQF